MARAGPSRSIGPLPGGSKFLKLITGSKFFAPGIRIRYRSNFAVPVSEMRNVMQLENRAHTRVSPSALVNQPPLHTHPALGRRLDQDDPGVRAPVICRTGVPGRSAQGTVCRSRSGIPGRSCYWGTMTEPRCPQHEAGTPVDTTS